MKSRRRRPSHKVRNVLVALIAIAVVVGGIVTVAYLNPPKGGIVLLVTNMGNITIELYDDMPITTGNFRNLIRQGIYNGTIFHRVIAGFMIQGGDPTGTGFGDPLIPAIRDEFSANETHNRNDRGTIAMANAGANTGSSQFFINVGTQNNYLDHKHPVFGRVIEGMDVVDAISVVPTFPSGDNKDRPVTPVTLIGVSIIG